MTKVKLSEVIRRCQTRVDRCDTDLLYYVAGEHFESGEIDLAGRGEIAGSTIGPMFYYGFKPGDFLLVSRNPHLRKASRVDFAGICSEKTFVLETADEGVLLSEYLPWALQNDRFWDYAQENRHGSTNFFINWSTLADYEFELPPIENQKRIAAILWAAQSVRRNYRKLLKTCDDVVKSQFVEMFGDPRTQTKGLSKLGDHVQIVNGFAFKGEFFCDSGIPVIKIANVNSSTFAQGSMKFYEYDASLERFTVSPGDLLISLTGTVGKDDFAFPCIVDNSYEKYYLNQRNAKLIPFSDLVPTYLLHLLKNEFIHERLVRSGTGVRQCHLHNANIEAVSFKLPPRELQQEFADFAVSVDKSKFRLGTCDAMP